MHLKNCILNLECEESLSFKSVADVSMVSYLFVNVGAIKISAQIVFDGKIGASETNY